MNSLLFIILFIVTTYASLRTYGLHKGASLLAAFYSIRIDQTEFKRYNAASNLFLLLSVVLAALSAAFMVLFVKASLM